MDTVVYYKDSDGSVVGSSSSPGRVNIEQELSSWGVGISALRVSDDSSVKGKVRRVVNGTLTHMDDVSTLDKTAARKAALGKLRDAAGLTKEQINLIFGG